MSSRCAEARVKIPEIFLAYIYALESKSDSSDRLFGGINLSEYYLQDLEKFNKMIRQAVPDIPGDMVPALHRFVYDRASFEYIRAANKNIKQFETPDWLKNHVLAGKILTFRDLVTVLKTSDIPVPPSPTLAIKRTSQSPTRSTSPTKGRRFTGLRNRSSSPVRPGTQTDSPAVSSREKTIIVPQQAEASPVEGEKVFRLSPIRRPQV